MNFFQKIAIAYLASGCFVTLCALVGIVLVGVVNYFDSRAARKESSS